MNFLAPDLMETAIEEFFAKCEEHRHIGISLFDVRNKKVTIPFGWQFDPNTCYFLPPSISTEKH